MPCPYREENPPLLPLGPRFPHPAAPAPLPRPLTALTGTAAGPPPAPLGQRVPVGAGLATSPRAAPRPPRFRFPSLPGRGLGPALTHFQRRARVWRPRLPRAFSPAAAMGLTRQYLRYEPAALFGLVASARAGLAFVALRGERGRYVAVPACEHVFVWDTRKGEKVGAGSGAGAGPGCSVRGSWAAWSEGICAAERRLGGSDTSRASPPLGKGEHSPRLCYKVSLQLAHCPAVFQFSKLVY